MDNLFIYGWPDTKADLQIGLGGDQQGRTGFLFRLRGKGHPGYGIPLRLFEGQKVDHGGERGMQVRTHLRELQGDGESP